MIEKIILKHLKWEILKQIIVRVTLISFFLSDV
jgi:hypothetical protein